MTLSYRRLFLVVGLCLSVGLIEARPAAASPTSISYKGVTITPAIENLAIQKGQTMASFTIMVTNNTKSPVSLHTSSLDFKSLNDSGGVAFITNGADQLGHKYGLASWLGIDQAIVYLQPDQTKPVHISVENRSDLSPGGHYAAVLFKAADQSKGGQTRVDINQVVSGLVFVRKVDGERYGLSLVKPSLPLSLWQLPTNLDLFFKNTGNVQTSPHGLVVIKSPLSHEVSRGLINTDSSLVLPESTRLTRTALFRTGHAWLPGWYHVHITYRYDNSTTTETYNDKLLYLNLPGIAMILIGLAGLIYILRRTARVLRRRHRHTPSKRPGKRIDIQTP